MVIVQLRILDEEFQNIVVDISNTVVRRLLMRYHPTIERLKSITESDIKLIHLEAIEVIQVEILNYITEHKLLKTRYNWGTINYGEISKRELTVNTESIPSHYYDVQLQLPNLLNDIRSEVERMVKNENSNV